MSGYIQPEEEVEPVINIVFTRWDIYTLAQLHHVAPELAIDRVYEWRKHIEETMSGYIWEQLDSVIRTGQP